MPDTSAKPRGGSTRIDARSQELTKNLVSTRHQLENHFKSIKRREAVFKRQKLVSFDHEFKAVQRMSRCASPGLEGKSPRSRTHSPQRERSSSRTRCASQVAGRSSASPQGLGRCWSSPDGLSTVQFPDTWGGHGALPKPPGHPAAFPLSVHRASASVPACYHPPPHPGASSTRPALTRSMAAYASSVGARDMVVPAMATSSAPSSPTALPSPAWRLPMTDRRSISSVASNDSEEDFDAVTASVNGGYSNERSEKDPMISRLGHYMALLGPRYKLSKEMIWEKAERGELTPAQRRLQKQGGIVAVLEREGGLLASSSSAPAVGKVVAADSDGKARAAWLAARASERDRGTRKSSSGLVTRSLSTVS